MTTTFKEIWLMKGKDVTIRDEVIDGKPQPRVDLFELLPTAIKSSMPMKSRFLSVLEYSATNQLNAERNGRLYRPGLTQDGGRVPLGAIESILRDKPLRALGLPKVNYYPLSRVPKGDDLLCEVFLDE